MSIINQMLQDLEQRRTVTAGESPLGGVSASNVAMRSVAPMNYLLLGAALVLAVVTAFLFGSQRSISLPSSSPAVVMPTVKETQPAREKATEVIVASSPNSTQSVKTEPAPGPAIVVAKAEPAHTMPMRNSAASVETNVESNADSAEKSAEKITAPIVKNETKAIEAKIAEQVVDDDESVSPMVIDKHIRPLSVAQQAQQYFQQAVMHLNRGKQHQAHDELIKALSIDPTHVRARETLAALLLNTGRMSEAGSTLRDGLRINPGAATLAKMYARILADQGSTEESIIILERARPSVASDPEYHSLLAAFYQRVGKYGQAAQSYQQVLQVRPGVAQWWTGLALSLESVGETAQALASYQRAQRLGGLNTDVKKFVSSRVNALALVVPNPVNTVVSSEK